MTMPIRHRLAIVCAALVSALIVGLGALVYVRLEADLLGAVDDELRTRATAIVNDGNGPDLDISPTDVGDIFAQRVARDGRVLASTPGLLPEALLTPAELSAVQDPHVSEGVISTTVEPVLVRLLAMAASDDSIVITGVTIDDQRAALATFVSHFALALPVAIVLAAGVGWLVAGAALGPVERIRVEAEAISGGELDRRLSVPETRDELTALGASLNRMLARIQDTVERERRFVDDASHELRTPLANLKSELDLGLRRSRSEAELIAVLRSAGEETDRLVRLAEDLLVLARADGGRLPIRRETVDLEQLARETVDSFASRIANLGVTVDIQVPLGISASVDPVRIRQALGNLIENAIRNTPAAGRVTVTVEEVGSELSIVVADSGPGFPAGFVATAFEPFSRVDAARGRSDGGAGLGLAIVRAVAEAHGGVAEARNGQLGGAEVGLRFPAWS
jgi:two-component system OmpR family sensor kinase